MTRYLTIRILLIFPMIIIISMLVFFLSLHIPQDPVESILTLRGLDFNENTPELYDELYKELGLDKPNFYFSIVPHNYPATLNRLSSSELKENIKEYLRQGYYYDNLDLDNLEKLTKSQKATTIFYPKFYWNGANNRYHNWLTSLLTDTFGTSLANGKPVSTIVGKAILWTASIGIFGILLELITSVLLGIYLADKHRKKAAKIVKQILYLVYAIPFFWLATMAVMYLTTDAYGTWTNIFPSVGIDVYPGKTTMQQILANWKKLILPVLCASLGSIAYIAIMLRRSILDEMSQPYILTAYSKGLDRKEALIKHALPNALLPMITLLVGAIPATLGGSVILEVIFNIPGIGRLLYDSINIGDWNVVFFIVMIIAVITILSYLLGDMLYARVNPKIRFA